MQISLAPLEGVTGYVVRNAFHHNFGGIDTYYTPFISAGKNLKGKSLRDILPENNEGIRLIPQLMSNNAAEVHRMGKQLAAYGYNRINLNIGCPSGTVTSKKRGSGLFLDLELLDRFLDEVFDATDMKISVKTRIGFSSPDEWPAILEIYRKYPIEELIIHPRVRAEFYGGKPHLACYETAVRAHTDFPLCYNGDIASVADSAAILERFPGTDRIMIGRGLIAHPGLAAEIRHAASHVDSVRSDDRQSRPMGKHAGDTTLFSDDEYRGRIRAFHDEIYLGLCQSIQSEKDAMLHMKEIWGYLKDSFADSDKAVKKIRRSQNCMEYKIAVNELFAGEGEYPLVR